MHKWHDYHKTAHMHMLLFYLDAMPETHGPPHLKKQVLTKSTRYLLNQCKQISQIN